MNNYICINNQKVELTNEQVDQFKNIFGISGVELDSVAVGDTVKIGDFEMVVLEQYRTATALILKNLYGKDTEFSNSNNDYRGSLVDARCGEFAKELAEVVGDDNIILHEVDLTSDDGLKDYGIITRKVSLLTTEWYRQHVDVLDTVNPEKWWWLATAHSTKRHDNDVLAKCVSPSGSVYYDHCDFIDIGVRPFCILKSNIFVSKEGA